MALANTLLMLARRAIATLSVVLLASTQLHAQSSVTEVNDAGWKALRDGYSVKAAALLSPTTSAIAATLLSLVSRKVT